MNGINRMPDGSYIKPTSRYQLNGKRISLGGFLGGQGDILIVYSLFSQNIFNIISFLSLCIKKKIPKINRKVLKICFKGKKRKSKRI